MGGGGRISTRKGTKWLEFQGLKGVAFFLLKERDLYSIDKTTLKRACHKIFDFRFFHESVSSRSLRIPWGPFRIYKKIRGDIR
jgi:hypothetical protein